MEILYLWIKDFSNIQRQGFNFSNKYIINFNEENELKIDKNENNNINNFFPDKIINISAIIGENGAGKSSILEFLKYNKKRYEYILIVKKNENVYIYYYENNMIKNIDEIKAKGYFVEKIFEKEEKEEIRVYYSNIFDGKNNDVSQEVNGLINISTNHLLRKYHKDRKKIDLKAKEIEGILTQLEKLKTTNLENENKENLLTNIERVKDYLYLQDIAEVSIISTYNLYEVMNQIIFFAKAKELDIFKYLNIPEKIVLKINNSFYKNTNYKRKFENIYNYFHKKVDDFLEKHETVNEEIASTIIISRILLYIFDKIIYSNGNHNYEKLIGEINITKMDDIKVFLNVIFKLVKEAIPNSAEEIETLEKIFKVISQMSKDDLKIESGNISFNVETKEKEKLKKLVELMIKLKYEKEIILLSWKNEFSSGEISLATIFSRIYSNLNQINKSKNCLLLLDEPDIYMHPEWQRNFLIELTIFIKTYITVETQVIITSHSPFIISDLPAENIVFLKKENTACKVVSYNCKNKTFASNIHTLFTNFMESTTGAFAKEKLSDIMRKLWDNNNISKKEMAEIKMIIDLIGEPIVKTMLLKKYDERFTTKEFEKNRYIEELEKKVENIDEESIDGLIDILQKNIKKLKTKRNIENIGAKSND